MKFKIKNCEYCTWYNSPERLEPEEFCCSHEDKKDQPPAILKAIKKVKKERRENRITNWILVLVLFIFTTLSFIGLFGEQKKSQTITFSIFLTACIIFIISTIYEIVNDEKTAKNELKQLQKKKSQWIIEYEM